MTTSDLEPWLAWMLGHSQQVARIYFKSER